MDRATIDLAGRILIHYEAQIETNGKVPLSERIAAMCKTVEALKLKEGADPLEDVTQA